MSTEDRSIVVMCYCYAAGSGAFRVVVPCLLEYFSHTLMVNILSGPQHPICEREDGWYSTSLSISFSNIWLLSSSKDLATSYSNMFTSISLVCTVELCDKLEEVLRYLANKCSIKISVNLSDSSYYLRV